MTQIAQQHLITLNLSIDFAFVAIIGDVPAASEYSLLMTAKFECGEEKYTWLDNVIAIGRGEQSRGGATYAIFEMN